MTVKIIGVPRSEVKTMFRTNFASIEEMLQKKSEEGWEVVSVSSNDYVANLAGGLLITLQREKE